VSKNKKIIELPDFPPPPIAGDLPLSQFAAEFLGIEVWSKLEEIFKAVEDGRRKILIRSCNGAGKTCALAAICNSRERKFILISMTN
jgi:hypothetical protein